MQFGDTIRIEMKDGQGQSIFGAIEQKVVAARMSDPARPLRRGRQSAGGTAPQAEGAQMSEELPRTLKFATVWLLLGRIVFLGFQWHQHEARRRPSRPRAA